jgi:hypothetical protein
VTLSDGGGSDEEIKVQDPGTIGDGTGGAPDPGGPSGTALSRGNDDIAVALASSSVELDPGSSVKVDFAVSTGTGKTFGSNGAVNALTIDAEDADDN